MNDTSYTQNRELSWLKFNQRVLEESIDANVPLLEKLNFISIFTSNLDEFFMIRVGSLTDSALVNKKYRDNKSGLGADEQLDLIYKETELLYRKRENSLRKIEEQMQENDIYRVSVNGLNTSEIKYMHHYFREHVLPLLSPQVIGSRHPFPHLINLEMYISVMLEHDKQSKKVIYGIIGLPHATPRAIFLQSQKTTYVLLEDLIQYFADEVFDNYKVIDRTILRVCRNADINLEDNGDFPEDYRKYVSKILKKRARLSPIRLEVEGSSELESELLQYFMLKLNLEEKQVFFIDVPFEFKYLSELHIRLDSTLRNKLSYTPYKPQWPSSISKGSSIIKQVNKSDRLLSFPYECADPFLDMVREAVDDKNVVAIKITVYRLADSSLLMEYLIKAAEQGINVTVIVELRARFDEANNINWAVKLEEAGCNIFYGPPGFKIHAKVCLIIRSERNNIQYLCQFGTGNYNEKTVTQYTDLMLITSDPRIGKDAVNFFRNMAQTNLSGHYDNLLVAPHEMKNKLIELIEGERDKAKMGLDASIRIKMNSLSDRILIDKLMEASQAGVKIDMIIRGICCIIPGVPGKTENIRIHNIVGRFLEHSRFYCFGDGAERQMYLSSADWMTRNTERRVEIACRVYDRGIQEQILDIFNLLMSDNVKGRRWNQNGDLEKIPRLKDAPLINAQEKMMIKEEPKKRFKLLYLFHRKRA